MPVYGAVPVGVASMFIIPLFMSRSRKLGLVKTGRVAVGSWLTSLVLLQLSTAGDYLNLIPENLGPVLAGIGILSFGLNMNCAVVLTMGSWFVGKRQETP
jgi:hypothetical protein